VNNAFAGSITSLVSALVDTEQISNEELDEIQELINKNKEE
jgi:predicted transcriptional regulator